MPWGSVTVPGATCRMRCPRSICVTRYAQPEMLLDMAQLPWLPRPGPIADYHTVYSKCCNLFRLCNTSLSMRHMCHTCAAGVSKQTHFWSSSPEGGLGDRRVLSHQSMLSLPVRPVEGRERVRRTVLSNAAKALSAPVARPASRGVLGRLPD